MCQPQFAFDRLPRPLALERQVALEVAVAAQQAQSLTGRKPPLQQRNKRLSLARLPRKAVQGLARVRALLVLLTRTTMRTAARVGLANPQWLL